MPRIQTTSSRLLRLSAGDPRSHWTPSCGLGDTVEAFVWLRRAAEIHDPFLVYNFVTEPLVEPLKRDPRGGAILREMGLAEGR
jgi:hypothetical protein